MGTTKTRYPAEVRARAVRLVVENQVEHPLVKGSDVPQQACRSELGVSVFGENHLRGGLMPHAQLLTTSAQRFFKIIAQQYGSCSLWAHDDCCAGGLDVITEISLLQVAQCRVTASGRVFHATRDARLALALHRSLLLPLAPCSAADRPELVVASRKDQRRTIARRCYAE